VREKKEINGRDQGRQTALHYAASGGHEMAVQLLLEKGAAADIEDGKRRVVLHKAVRNDDKAVVRLLLKRRAKVSTGDMD
jgi:ankyrin repeat protein